MKWKTILRCQFLFQGTNYDFGLLSSNTKEEKRRLRHIEWKNLVGSSWRNSGLSCENNQSGNHFWLIPSIKVPMQKPATKTLLLKDALQVGNCRLRHRWKSYNLLFLKKLVCYQWTFY